MTADQQPSTGNFNQRPEVNLALQAAGIGVWELDLATRQIHWDERCRKLFRVSNPDQMADEQGLRHIHPDDQQRVEAAIRRATDPQGEGYFDQTYRILPVDDKPARWVRAVGRAVFTPAGELSWFGGTAQDMTQPVTDRQALQESETRFRSLVEESPVATCLFVGRELRIEMANQAMIQMWGKGPDVVGLPLADALPELRSQHFLATLDHLFLTGEAYQARGGRADLVIDGQLKTFYFDYDFKPLRTPQGAVYAILETATDVTQQVLAQQRIEQSQQELLALFEQSPVALATISADEHLVFEWANTFYGVLVARPPQAIVGKPLLDALPELKGQGFDAILKTVIATNTPFSAQEVAVNVLRDKQLTTIFVNLTYQPRRDADGAVRGILVVATDVTQQVVTRRKVEENETRLHSIIDLTELGIYTIDLTTNQLTKSPRLAHWYGLPEVTDVASSIDVIQKSDQERVRQVLTDALRRGATGHYDVEYGVIHAQTGQQRILRTTGQVVYDLAGQPLRIDGSVLDVTSQRALQLSLEEQVQQRTQELAALNEQLAATNQELVETNHLLVRSNDNLQTFAYVASHDLQEPLRKVMAFGDLLKIRYADSSGDELVYIERMQSAAQRMSTLIKDLLNYARLSTQRDDSGPVPLGKVVEQVLTTLELSIQETGAQITVDDLPDVLGDASQLGQLFQNLLSNALKFRRLNVVPRIIIQASWLAADHLPEAITPSRRAMAYYRIDVSDNGVGFEEKYLDRIFQVFQRLHSKREFAGTGIGLAICEKVVANHGGAITARSQPGQGATFSVYLPA